MKPSPVRDENNGSAKSYHEDQVPLGTKHPVGPVRELISVAPVRDEILVAPEETKYR
jgi:hypothetical protein